MIDSDDPEIAEIGAKLIVEKNGSCRCKKWNIEIYRDTKGNLHTSCIFRIKSKAQDGTIYCVDLKYVNGFVFSGFNPKSYLSKLGHILEYDKKTNRFYESK